jgi:hypothetical protein
MIKSKQTAEKTPLLQGKKEKHSSIFNLFNKNNAVKSSILFINFKTQG